jgi:hypothetical protein
MSADRLAFALTHPLTLDGHDEPIDAYRRTEEQRDGNLLTTILAVDR